MKAQYPKDLPRDRLASAAGEAIGWVTRNLRHFSPVRHGLVEARNTKPIAELAFVYMFLDEWRSTSPVDGIPWTELDVWYDFIRCQVEDASFAELPRKRPDQGFGFILTYLMLRARGYRSAYYEQSLRFLNRWSLLDGTEVFPYRLLERNHSLWKSGVLKRPDWRGLYERTRLHRARGSIYLDQNDAYAVTHTIFYLTDLGNRRAPLGGPERHRAVRLLESLVVHNWRIRNWDLLGELLACLNSLGCPNSALHVIAGDRFLKAQRKDGAIPADAAHQRHVSSKNAPAARIFSSCYHTTLVGVLYSMTALRNEHA